MKELEYIEFSEEELNQARKNVNEDFTTIIKEEIATISIDTKREMLEVLEKIISRFKPMTYRIDGSATTELGWELINTASDLVSPCMILHDTLQLELGLDCTNENIS